MTQSNSIGFVIWGVRNGFEMMAASDPNHVLKEVVNDNMRQVCNSAPERLYTVHHTERFSAVSIYHTDAKDVVGRRAYIAITLYVSKGMCFTGDVPGTLNRLMDFYISKQGNAKVNMFTEDMVREQYAGLGVENLPNNSKPAGKKMGIWRYQHVNEIGSYLTHLNTDGYRAVFFLSPANAESEKQLMGYEVISSFVRPVVLTLLGYSAAGYTIYLNNRQLPPSQQDYYEVEGMPGDQVRVSKTGTGREKSMQLLNVNQEHKLSTLFPSSGGGSGSGGGRSGPNEPQLSWKKITVFLLVFAAIIGTAVYFTLGSRDGEGGGDEQGGGETPNTPDTATVIKEKGNDTTKKLVIDSVVKDTVILSAHLDTKQRTAIRDSVLKIANINISYSPYGDTVYYKRSTSLESSIIKNLVQRLYNSLSKKPKTTVIPPPTKHQNTDKLYD